MNLKPGGRKKLNELLLREAGRIRLWDTNPLLALVALPRDRAATGLDSARALAVIRSCRFLRFNFQIARDSRATPPFAKIDSRQTGLLRSRPCPSKPCPSLPPNKSMIRRMTRY